MFRGDGQHRDGATIRAFHLDGDTAEKRRRVVAAPNQDGRRTVADQSCDIPRAGAVAGDQFRLMGPSIVSAGAAVGCVDEIRQGYCVDNGCDFGLHAAGALSLPPESPRIMSCTIRTSCVISA